MSSPKHLNKKKHYEVFYNTLENQIFCKELHPVWGSILTTPNDRQLWKTSNCLLLSN